MFPRIEAGTTVEAIVNENGTLELVNTSEPSNVAEETLPSGCPEQPCLATSQNDANENQQPTDLVATTGNAPVGALV